MSSFVRLLVLSIVKDTLNPLNGLDRADLIVCVHDADMTGFATIYRLLGCGLPITTSVTAFPLS